MNPDEKTSLAYVLGRLDFKPQLKENANAELLVKGHPVFNPQKGMTMVLAQSVEVIERKPRPAKAA